MIQNRSCVNGILAAVLSSSVIPLHGALAREKSPASQRAAEKLAAAWADRRDSMKDNAAKPENKSATAAQ